MFLLIQRLNAAVLIRFFAVRRIVDSVGTMNKVRIIQVGNSGIEGVGLGDCEIVDAPER